MTCQLYQPCVITPAVEVETSLASEQREQHRQFLLRENGSDDNHVMTSDDSYGNCTHYGGEESELCQRRSAIGS